MSGFFDIRLFQEQLEEAMIWCSRQLSISNEANALRTLLPRPERLHRMDETGELGAFAERVFKERKRRLDPNRNLPILDKINLQGGSLVVFLADHACAWDGIAEIESRGYFDYFEYPPWDSWVYFVSRNDMEVAGSKKASTHLIAWVPPQFTNPVEVAIPQNNDYALMTLKDAKELFPYLTVVDNLVE